jgi:hypothetical protein
MSRIAAALAILCTAASLGAGTARATKAAGLPALDTAGPFLLDDIRLKVDGRWAVAWDSLYPLHRLVAPRATFVRCEARSRLIAPLDSMRVVSVRRAAVRVPGRTRTVDGVAVTIHVALPWYGPRDPIVFTHTFHLVPVNGRWTWLLSPERYRLYRSGACSAMPAV